jgi:hypothetical protein
MILLLHRDYKQVMIEHLIQAIRARATPCILIFLIHFMVQFVVLHKRIRVGSDINHCFMPSVTTIGLLSKVGYKSGCLEF